MYGMYVCIYACMYVCMWCMYISIYVCIYICMYVCKYVCMYNERMKEWKNERMNVCMYVCMYMYTFVSCSACNNLIIRWYPFWRGQRRSVRPGLFIFVFNNHQYILKINFILKIVIILYILALYLRQNDQFVKNIRCFLQKMVTNHYVHCLKKNTHTEIYTAIIYRYI